MHYTTQSSRFPPEAYRTSVESLGSVTGNESGRVDEAAKAGFGGPASSGSSMLSSRPP